MDCERLSECRRVADSRNDTTCETCETTLPESGTRQATLRCLTGCERAFISSIVMMKSWTMPKGKLRGFVLCCLCATCAGLVWPREVFDENGCSSTCAGAPDVTCQQWLDLSPMSCHDLESVLKCTACDDCCKTNYAYPPPSPTPPRSPPVQPSPPPAQPVNEHFPIYIYPITGAAILCVAVGLCTYARSLRRLRASPDDGLLDVGSYRNSPRQEYFTAPLPRGTEPAEQATAVVAR